MPPPSLAGPSSGRSTADEELGGAYAGFYEAVAKLQLAEWLPPEPSVLLDLSAADGQYATEIAKRGHVVVHLLDGEADAPSAVAGLHVVRGDIHDLRWLRAGAYDAVLAESSTLSHCLAFEESLRQLAVALRPGGRLMLSVDSLVLGLAHLAEQARWAELADVPAADVVLVPGPDGRITRCFWPEDFEQMLIDAGFVPDWIRPRTVLSPEAVHRALAADPTRLDMLVQTELTLERDRQGESIGYHLVAAATKV